MLGCEDIVDTADGRIVRSRLNLIGVSLSLLGYLAHHSDKAIECFLTLVLRRLNHQRLVEEQREVYGRCMIAIIEQAFRHVHSGNTSRLILQAVEHKLVTADSVDRQLVDILQALFDVVGVEHS